MLDTFKELIANQSEAALCTLNTCIDRCSETAWDAPVGNHPFCQVAFHTLFFTDYYLGPDEESFRRQPFHRDNELLELFKGFKIIRYHSILLHEEQVSCRAPAAKQQYRPENQIGATPMDTLAAAH